MKLKLEEIRVDSFAINDVAPDGRGTVHAHASLLLITCRATCPGRETCPECPVR